MSDPKPLSRPAINNQIQKYSSCFLAVHGTYEGLRSFPACVGRLSKAHLIHQQELRRSKRKFPELDIWDQRVWVWACGGHTGAAGHHAMFDKSKTLRLTRDRIPLETEDFAKEYELEWFLDRYYGEIDDSQS